MTNTIQATTAPLLIAATNKEREIERQVLEHSKTLGIPVPTVLIAGRDGTPKQILQPRGLHQYRTYLGYTFDKTHEVFINPTAIKRTQKRLKEHPNYYNYRYNRYYKINKKKYTLPWVVAHEMIHLAFPKLVHGDRFEDYFVQSLLDGHMVFYIHKQIKQIITTIHEPKDLEIDKEILKLNQRKKALETRVKRTTTAIKKIDRKIRRLEKKNSLNRK